MEVAGRDISEVGVIYLLPDSRRFDFYPEGDQPVRKGAISAILLKNIFGGQKQISPGIIGTKKKAGFKVREVKQRTGGGRISYTLTQLEELAAS